MRYIWKLLREHISKGQLLGFFFANLLGVLIILLGFQFYRDVVPAFYGDDSIMSDSYLVVSKRIDNTSGSLFGGQSLTFTEDEMSDLQSQQFVLSMGAFTASQYEVRASLALEGVANLSTDMFFEAVPDDFVDIELENWTFDPDDPNAEIPIVLPRNYLAIYNFGFAQSRNLPKLTEELICSIGFNLRLRGDLSQHTYRGRVVGFGRRLNTILVPQDFMEWSNSNFAPSVTPHPTRLIIKVSNPADERIAQYLEQHEYDVEDDKADSGKITYMLRIVSGVIMGVGLLISVLSLYILMLSVYLLVQKNTQKLQNLLLIGYTESSVARPYQILTVSMNLAVTILAIVVMCYLRSIYLDLLSEMFPGIDGSSMLATYGLALCIFLFVSTINIIAIRRKIHKIQH